MRKMNQWFEVLQLLATTSVRKCRYSHCLKRASDTAGQRGCDGQALKLPGTDKNAVCSTAVVGRYINNYTRLLYYYHHRHHHHHRRRIRVITRGGLVCVIMLPPRYLSSRVERSATKNIFRFSRVPICLPLTSAREYYIRRHCYRYRRRASCGHCARVGTYTYYICTILYYCTTGCR